VHTDRIESVQKLFLLFPLRGLKWDQNVRVPSYSSRLKLINLTTIVNRRAMLCDIDSVDLVSRLNFNVPVRLMRNYYPINLPRCTSNFSQHEPFCVVSNYYNILYHLTCSSTSSPVLKTKILAHLLKSYFIYVLSCS